MLGLSFLNFYFFKGISEEYMKNKGKLPRKSIQFKEGNHPNDVFLKGLIILMPIYCYMVFRALKIYNRNSTILKLDIYTIIIIISFIIIARISAILHEIIHGIFYPLHEKKYIFLDTKSGYLMIYCNAEISKIRFCLINIMPLLIQGIGAYIVWKLIVNKIELRLSMASLFLAWYMMIFATVDVYNIVYTIFRVPSNAKIINYGMHSYWMLREDKTNEV